MKFLRNLLAFLVFLPLSACDEPTVISHVDRRPDMVLDELWKIQDDRGIPVEIHGTPFHRVTDDALTAALKVPANAPQDIRFYLSPAGSAQGGHPWRLVLHFNPQGGPNAYNDCRMTAEARTNPRPENTFTMNATFCNGQDWTAHGFLEVLEIEDGDIEAFTRHFQTLVSAIFQEEQDR